MSASTAVAISDEAVPLSCTHIKREAYPGQSMILFVQEELALVPHSTTQRHATEEESKATERMREIQNQDEKTYEMSRGISSIWVL